MCNTLNSTLSYIIFYCLDQTECESTRSNEWGEPCEVWSIWIHGTFTCRKLIIYFISFYVLKLLCCSCRLLSLSLQLYISCKWLHFKMQCKLIMTWSNSSIEKLIFPYSCMHWLSLSYNVGCTLLFAFNIFVFTCGQTTLFYHILHQSWWRGELLSLQQMWHVLRNSAERLTQGKKQYSHLRCLLKWICAIKFSWTQITSSHIYLSLRTLIYFK